MTAFNTNISYNLVSVISSEAAVPSQRMRVMGMFADSPEANGFQF